MGASGVGGSLVPFKCTAVGGLPVMGPGDGHDACSWQLGWCPLGLGLGMFGMVVAALFAVCLVYKHITIDGACITLLLDSLIANLLLMCTWRDIVFGVREWSC